jgi:16S rRNA (cytosine967-C5)-methyltransferase
VLVYSTCTISPIENEQLIAAFLDSNPQFVLDDLGATQPGLRLADALAAGGETSHVAQRTLLTLPARDRTAGFFIARLLKS